MSALVERIIAARDRAKQYRDRDLLDALADAANAITERDQAIHAQTTKAKRLAQFSTVELYNCATYALSAKTISEAGGRGQELARMVVQIFEASGELGQ
jgi:hypothetical protein